MCALDSQTVKKAAFPSADSVYRLHPRDQKQRSWFVFDPTHLLPEYLVEFKYKFANDSQDCIARQNGSTSEVEGVLTSERGRGPEIPPEKHVCESLRTIPKDDPTELRSWVAETCTPVSRDDKGVLLRDEYISRQSSLKDLHGLTHLNLHNCNIIGIEHLKSLTGLKVLILSFNKINKIQGLDELHSLKKLDLSFNLLKCIDGLNGVSNLESLELTGNEIWNLDDLAVLRGQVMAVSLRSHWIHFVSKCHAWADEFALCPMVVLNVPCIQVPRLLNLNLRCNPVVEEFGYRSAALRAVPSLKTLDCIAIVAGNSCNHFVTHLVTAPVRVHKDSCYS